jgi:Leucine-rich repeat (LRR) protein
MKNLGGLTLGLLLASAAVGCDEHKYDAILAEAAAPAATPASLPTSTASAVASAAPAPTWKKKNAADCKPHPTAVDFGDDTALENEVRRKLGKDAGPIAPADLAQIKSINLASAKVHQIDPCIFPMFTSLKDLFLGPGEYDDLTPIQKIATLESLRISLSQVKDLHAIEGLKKLDRLDISHTRVGDDELKSVGSLVNVTELMLDEDNVSDLAPIANLKKLERLSIKKTMVKSLAPLSQLKTLKFLYIADSAISDITPVQPLMSSGMKLIQN